MMLPRKDVPVKFKLAPDCRLTVRGSGRVCVAFCAAPPDRAACPAGGPTRTGPALNPFLEVEPEAATSQDMLVPEIDKLTSAPAGTLTTVDDRPEAGVRVSGPADERANPDALNNPTRIFGLGAITALDMLPELLCADANGAAVHERSHATRANAAARRTLLLECTLSLIFLPSRLIFF